MPKFQDNKGFKMPGVGSKNKHTTGSFREDANVDKMGYCDTTPEHMLPADSSPMQYSTASYKGKADFGTKKADTPVDSPVKYKTIVDDDPYSTANYSGNADFGTKGKKGPEKKTKTPVVESKETTLNPINEPDYDPLQGDTGKNVDIDLGGKGSSSTNTDTGYTKIQTPDSKSSYQGEKMSDEAWKALTPEKRRDMNKKVGANKKGEIVKKGSTLENWTLNGKKVTKAIYDAAKGKG